MSKNTIISLFDSICFEQGENGAIIFGCPSSTAASSVGGQNESPMEQQRSPPLPAPPLCYYELQHASQTLACQLIYRYRPTYVLLDLRDGVAAEVVAMLACMRIGVPFVPVSTEEYHMGDRLSTVVRTLQQTSHRTRNGHRRTQSANNNTKLDANVMMDDAPVRIVALVRCKDDTDPIVQTFANADIHNLVYLNDNGDMLEPMDVPQSIQELPAETRLSSATNQQHDDNENDDLYILFTSGTSGNTPKAVVGSHQSTIKRLLWFGRNFPSTSQTVVVRRSKLTFVDSITEVFSSLLFPPSKLYALPTNELQTKGISVVQQSPHKDIITRVTMLPSQLSQLLLRLGRTTLKNHDDSDNDKNGNDNNNRNGNKDQSLLEMIIISGEPCPAGLLVQYQRTKFLSSTKLLNLYGQTESTGDVTCAVLTDMKHPIRNHVVAVGSPITGVTISTDSNNQLLISGNLSNGYLIKNNNKSHDQKKENSDKQPSNNRDQSFDPFASGDIGFCQDGIWYVRGRSDDICKINGVLTSPSEVESAFSSVYNSPRHDSECHAVACIVNKEVYMLADEKLNFRRDTMRKAGIPWNLIPSKIFFHTPIPTSKTGAGKVDRTTVKQIIQEHLSCLNDYCDPKKRTSGSDSKVGCTDQFLTILSEVLGLTVKDDGMSLSFAELGGDSALAITLLYKFNVEGICQNEELTAKDIVESESLPSLRKMLLSRNDEEGNTKIPKRRRKTENTTTAVPFTPRPIKLISKHHIAVDFKACVDAAPLIHRSAIYAACQGGVIQRLLLDDVDKGVCGCYDLGWKIQADMVVIDESLIICGYNPDRYIGLVAALDLALEKTPKWTTEVSGTVKSTPVVVDGRIYVVSGKTLNVINPIDGTCILTQEFPSETEAKPAVITKHGSSTAIFAFSDWDVGVAIVKQGGTVIKFISHNSLAPVYADLLTIDHNHVLICDIFGFCYDLNPEAMKFISSTKLTTKPIFSGPTMLKDEHIVIGCHDGVLRCIDKMDFANTHWKVDAQAVIYAKSRVVDDRIFACTTAGDLLEIGDGKCVWRYMLDAEIWSDITVYDEKATGGKRVVAVGARDSRLHLIYVH